jgi:hypothetical protein
MRRTEASASGHDTNGSSPANPVIGGVGCPAIDAAADTLDSSGQNKRPKYRPRQRPHRVGDGHQHRIRHSTHANHGDRPAVWIFIARRHQVSTALHDQEILVRRELRTPATHLDGLSSVRDPLAARPYNGQRPHVSSAQVKRKPQLVDDLNRYSDLGETGITLFA